MELVTKPLMYWVFISIIVFAAQLCNGFYLPGSYMHTYVNGDVIYAKVNSLTSIETELPFSYYSLPYCKPLGGIKKSAENLGELLMGDQIDNSPYRFRMNVNESIYICTTTPLNEHEVKLLKQRTQDLYQVNMILDNLPVMRFAVQNGVKIQWTGFPVGYTPPGSSDDYIINHLKFTILVHEYEGSNTEIIGTGEEGLGVISESDKSKASGYQIVGFQVSPCSVKYDPEVMTSLHMYDNITSVSCPSELDKYQMEGSKVHWFSIMNSLMVIFFLAGIVFVIFLRTVRRDLTRYEELDKEAQAQMNEELSGWKLVVGDVFREPSCSKLLCIMVGDGVQILGMGGVTIVFAALGFMSPASRGMLLTGMIVLYLILGIAAGYVSVRLWSTIKGTSEGWRSVSWSAACFFPGIAFIILTVLNFILWGSNSTGAIPISLYFELFFLWFCISVPLTMIGGFMGTKAEAIEYPVRTNQIPREIPARKYPSWLLVLGAGTLPFGTLFIELFFILSSIWLGRFYYVFGFLLSLSGPVSATLYLGYSLLMAVAIMLATGTIVRPPWGAKPSGRDFREETNEKTQDAKTPHPTQNLKADQPSALIPLVRPPWGAKPSGRNFREEPSEETQDEKTPHPTQNLKRCTNRGTHRSNHLVVKTFDASHKYSLKPGRSTIGSDTTC
ncbi:Transmembrane 9 superfamily member 12 [Stylosanthes scabra]|uniref:Transmembrane 9 superfamily member n=1 Tax=Stylosanthes scabra TaxID=79078 RepID=A0ABU6W9S8_9FABA|nr:Transmembrane 9 superfamily member 12 [Stylosanthes scabra]